MSFSKNKKEIKSKIKEQTSKNKLLKKKKRNKK